MSKRLAQPLFWLVLALVVGAAIVVRLYAAWCFRFNLNLDAGVVALMSKHISEGREWPIFFYGQPHMGSLEATIGGWICRVLGYNGFHANLGTAVVAMGLIPIVYHWARMAAGRLAGISAVFFIIIGPGGFFHYNGSPRGGYAAALTFGAFLLWLATYIVVRWNHQKLQSGWHYLFLGIGAGIAWWSSQLTTAAILTAALLLLLGLRQHLFTPRLFAGLMGFFAGSAPFWIYNIRHHWASFALGGSFGQTDYLTSLSLFFSARFAALMIPGAAPAWARMLILACYLLVFFVAFTMLIRCRHRLFTPSYSDDTGRDQTAAAWTLVGILLFTLSFAALYAASHFSRLNTPRYFLPMVAPIGVLIGMATAQLHKQKRIQWLAFIPLVIIVAGQVPTLWWAYSFSQTEAKQQEGLERFGAGLSERNIAAVYSPITQRAWNAALLERIAFSDVLGDFYPGISKQAEEAAVIAVMDNYSSAEQFSRHSGGRSERLQIAGLHLLGDFTPPAASVEPIDTQHIMRIRDHLDRDARENVTDGRISTHWSSPSDAGDIHLTIELREPMLVSGLRLTALEFAAFPWLWSLEGYAPETGWMSLYDQEPHSGYHWSGPRFYWDGPFPRLDIRFAPTTLSALRIHHHHSRPDNHLRIFDVQLFGPGEDLSDWEEQFSILRSFLSQQGIQRVYADRWLANRIAAERDLGIQTTRRPEWYADSLLDERHRVYLDSTTALLVERPDANQLRARLQARAIQFRETSVGPWHLFHDFEHQKADDIGLYWAGFTAFLNDPARATELWKEAQQTQDSGQRYLLLQKAVELNPHFIAPQRELGITPPHPRVKVDALFDRRIRLIGYDIENEFLIPGEPLHMKLYWEIDPDLEVSDLRVFVHFFDRGIVFQGDHGLLSSLSPLAWQEQPGKTIIPETRIIPTPKNLTSSETHIRLGIYRHRGGNRLPLSSDLPTRRRAVTLPTGIQVFSLDNRASMPPLAEHPKALNPF